MLDMVRVKICGVTSSNDAQLCAELGADAIGLNFYPKSPRAVSPFYAEKIVRGLPPFVATVGVFVNWAPEPVIALCQALRLNFAQLHGDESPQIVAKIARRIPVIQVLRVVQGKRPPDFARFKSASAFLLDAAQSESYGGTGKTIDWQLASQAAISHRIVLAGGLTPGNVAQAIATVHPYAVDVASGVETGPGRKDPAKLRSFLEAVKWANQR
jgi:phosphoribosylanthranilate isomerase